MRCALHIGSAKTGTSSLQELLYEKRAQLAAKGCIYPTSCLWQGDRSHNTLGAYFWNNFLEEFKTRPFGEVVESMLAEAAGHPTMILSSELIEKALVHGNGMLPAFLDRLVAAAYAIDAIYVVRRQDHYIDSQFKQAVGDFLTTYAGPVDQYVRTHSAALTYADTAAAWQAAPQVSTVTVIPYVEGRTDETFRQVLASMRHGDLLQPGVAIPRTNPSLDGTYLRLKHLLNRVKLPASLHQHFVARLAGVRAGGSDRLTLFSPEQRQQFLAGFAADHTRLSADFGLQLAGWDAGPVREGGVFVPMGLDELPSAMAGLKAEDAALHDEVVAAAGAELPLVQG